MAQNQFINVTIDPAATKLTDNANHHHSSVPGTAAAGNLTLSFDSAVFTNQSLLRSGVQAALAIAAGQLPK